MRLLKVFFLPLSLLSPLINAQATPSTLVIFGAGFTQKVSQSYGLFSYATKINSNNTYSYTTTGMDRLTSFTRTGLAQVLIQVPGITILAIGDGGVQTSMGEASKSLSYGGVAVFDLSYVFKKVTNTQLVAIIRPSTTGVGRNYEFGISRSLTTEKDKAAYRLQKIMKVKAQALTTN